MITIDYSSDKKDFFTIICDSKILTIIRENFSVPNPAFSSKRKYLPSRLYAITPSGRFEKGLLSEIVKNCEHHGFQVKLSDEIKKDLSNNNNFYGDLFNLSIEYRDYQEKAIREAINAKNGLIIIGTGGGKTLLTAGLIHNLQKMSGKENFKVLVTVPTLQLIDQTSKDFEDYGLKNISKWSGKNKLDPNANIIVAGTQFLVSKNTDLSILNDIDLFIADECHGYSKGSEINKVFKFLKTEYRFGLTGSLPSSDLDRWNIIGKFGKILFEKKTDDLKTNKYVSNFQVIILNIDHKGKSFSFEKDDPTSKYLKELDFLIKNDRRNDIITNLSLKLKNNTIIMVDRIENGEILYNLLLNKTQNTRKIYFIRGSTDIEDREKIRAIMDESDDVIAIAISKIFSTGINIPNLHNIIFSSAGKAKIKIVQSIGRSLRKHPTKDMAYIFDIADNTFYGEKHKNERIKIYKNEKYPFVEKFLQ